MRQGCKIIDLGKSTTIICGGEPQDHECNERSHIMGFSDGTRGTLFEKAKSEKLNLNMCDEDKVYFLDQKGIHITMESIACSICGRAEIDNMLWL